tara:strand:+ start:304 stop:426 length:123 start_codon:yes stop_codon:yes gene_type:complete
VSHCQKEWYWLIVLASFLLEREVLVDTLFMAMSFIFDNFF